MNAHRANVILERDGTLTLKDLPFQAGDVVEVIVLETPALNAKKDSVSLRGKILRYDDPTEPVAVQDWDVAA